MPLATGRTFTGSHLSFWLRSDESQQLRPGDHHGDANLTAAQRPDIGTSKRHAGIFAHVSNPPTAPGLGGAVPEPTTKSAPTTCRHVRPPNRVDPRPSRRF